MSAAILELHPVEPADAEPGTYLALYLSAKGRLEWLIARKTSRGSWVRAPRNYTLKLGGVRAVWPLPGGEPEPEPAWPEPAWPLPAACARCAGSETVLGFREECSRGACAHRGGDRAPSCPVVRIPCPGCSGVAP